MGEAADGEPAVSGAPPSSSGRAGVTVAVAGTEARTRSSLEPKSGSMVMVGSAAISARSPRSHPAAERAPVAVMRRPASRWPTTMSSGGLDSGGSVLLSTRWGSGGSGGRAARVVERAMVVIPLAAGTFLAS
ncbi:hypothetical protein [Serinibacter arcticus]|uniref:hypothetical protein n=1 Tax=Serinibacter arcticus TaxID=1655435 RepID=UPI001F1C1D55|nr:hypothetical protein [Serinibacter arcticus]